MSMEPNTFDHINSLTTLTTEQKSELLDLIQWEWERGWAEGYETATLHSTHSLVPDPTTPPAITPINEGEVWFRIYDPITGEGESEVTLAELYGENRDTLTIDEYMELCRMGEWETMMLGRFRVVRLGNDR